ncbi:MAG TPA: 5'-3' exonuclease H3TH domain-containing protein [Candidatus Woesebacteria bacterium]|nr:5'-3' exonuclease H3TH domain-containing protein [Candidatus Woesebacteria bacterium]HPJ17342.1 5'-3' exonuclease H3TH domain-containing protein [Candidatus Woesebacteria bacterium]
MSHLVIIDGHAIAHRAYHSIPPLSFNGQPLNAIYGFYSMLLSAIDQLKPKYLIVCLDSPGPTFRQTEYVAYRAQRKPTDHDLVSQLPLLPQTLEASAIKHYSLGGFEADDLIASLVSKSLKKISKKTKKKLVNKITVITGDKDLMQLVGPKVSLFFPVRGLSETKLYDIDGVKQRLEVLPSQVVDLKALMGDPSDNYPGVTGIGPKVATTLLSQYHTLDNIYSHLSELKPSISEKLIRDKDNAYLSQKLATLISNIPLDFTLSSAKIRPKNFQLLSQLFLSYNFKSLFSRLNKNNQLKPVKIKPETKTNQVSLF